MDMDNESFSLCEKVRFAVVFDEPMDENMKNHLCECEDCRTILEQQERIVSDLAMLKADTFIKNGKGVCESVMEEIENQSLFTGASPVKSRFVFKHAGLVAACIIVTVMALPLLNGILPGSKSADSVAFDEASQYNYSVSESENATDQYGTLESASGSTGTASKLNSDGFFDNGDVPTEEDFDVEDQEAPKGSVAESAEANVQNSVTNKLQTNGASKDDSFKSETYLYSDMKEYSDKDKFKDIVIMSPSEPAVENAENEETQEEAIPEADCDETQTEQVVDPVLYEIALSAANEYCTENSLAIKEVLSFTNTSENTVCAVFVTESEEQVTVLLKKDQTGFVVLNVWAEK